MTQGFNWDGYSHRHLYDMIHGTPPGGLRGAFDEAAGIAHEPGAGVAGAEEALQCWGELAALMDQARAATELALREAGASWEGAAAEAMQSGVTPLAQWAADANTAGAASQSSVDGHVASFSSAQHRMPEPVPVAVAGIPTTFADIFSGQIDQDKQETAAQEAKAEAVRVMSGYEGESTTAATSLGTFVPPPSVTVQVPPANPVGGEIGSFGGAFVGPTDGSGGGERTRTDTGTGTPGPASSTEGAQITTPDRVASTGGATTTTPAAPPDQVTPKPGPGPTPLLPAGPGPRVDRTAGGGTGRGSGGGVAGGGPGRTGPNPGRGGAIGKGPMAEGAAGSRGGAAALGARGAAGAGIAPLAAVGRGQGAEDRDHKPPAYLRDTHDDFWDDTPQVSPPVIGEEE